MSFMKWGSLTCWITNPRDMSGFVKELGHWKFSVMTVRTSLFNGLPHTARQLDFSGTGGGRRRRAEAGERCWQQVTGAYLTEASMG